MSAQIYDLCATSPKLVTNNDQQRCAFPCMHVFPLHRKLCHFITRVNRIAHSISLFEERTFLLGMTKNNVTKKYSYIVTL